MKNIILAVPERFFARYTTKALVKAGFHVSVCTNGDEVVQEIDKGVFSGLIVDQILPPGNLFLAENTEHGTQTGVIIAHYVSKRCPLVPIVLLVSTSRELKLPPRTSTVPFAEMSPQKAVELAQAF